MKLYNPYSSRDFFVGFGSVAITALVLILLGVLFPTISGVLFLMVIFCWCSYCIFKIVKYIFTGK